jgi:hypothetical protein
MKVAIVSLAIGDQYIERYNALFRPSQEAYAAQHGYDFRLITEYLDTELLHKNLISFQKLLVFSQPWSAAYDFIVFVDADIFININSPPVPLVSGKIGVVNEFAQPTKELRQALQEQCGWETTATEYYKLSGFDLDTDIAPNSGVLVLEPAIYGDYLKGIYEEYKDTAILHKRGFIYEQTAVGYCLVRDSTYALLPNRWNALWMINKFIHPHTTLVDFINANYFIHFAGNFDYEGLEYICSRPIHPDGNPSPQ